MKLSVSQVKELLSKNQLLQLKESLTHCHPVDIAKKMEDLNDSQKIIIFRLLDKDKSVKLFINLPFKIQNLFLKNLKNDEIFFILNSMRANEIVRVLYKLPKEEEVGVLNLIEKEKVEVIKKLLIYQEGSAGSLMELDFLACENNVVLREVIEKFKNNSVRIENTVFVCDSKGHFLDLICLQDLVNSDADKIIQDVIFDNEKIKNITIDEYASDEDVVDLFLKYNLANLPVVDKNGKLLGVIFVENILKLIKEKNTKEIYAIAKMHIEDNEDVSYFSSTSFDLLKRRAVWCVFLLVLDFLTVSILEKYELAIVRIVTLSFFLPMILNTGGNAGLQVSVSIIRALKRGEIKLSNFFNVIKKEMITALFLGILVGILVFVRAYLVDQSFVMALFVGFSLFLIVFMSSITGLFLPLLSKRIGLDPAVLSAPLIISIVDIIGLIIYFNIAIRFLPALKGVF